MAEPMIAATIFRAELDLIDPWPGNPRSAGFDFADIAASLEADVEGNPTSASADVREPLWLRETEGGRFESIKGARRAAAARAAGLRSVQGRLFVGSDAEALAETLVDLARQALSAQEEARAFAALRAGGLDEQAVAHRTGRPLRYVLRRLALLDLVPDVAEALRIGPAQGGITLEAAEAFAVSSAEVQADIWPRALAHAKTDGRLHVLLDTDLRRMLGRTRLRLADGGWKLDDATLVNQSASPPAASEGAEGPALLRPCDGCPRRTDAQTTMLGIDLPPGECTDPICYGAKVAATAARAVDRAKAAGVKVLDKAEARRILPASARGVPLIESGYVSLDAPSPIEEGEGPARRVLTWRMALPPGIVPDAAAPDASGKVVELVDARKAVVAAKAALKGEGSGAKKKAVDAWSVAAAARVVPPAPAPMPSAATPKAADTRAREEARGKHEALMATLGAVFDRGASDEVLAGWISRVVSSNALCMVAEMYAPEARESPAKVIADLLDDAAPPDVEDFDRRLGAALLAAHLLDVGGELAEMVTRSVAGPAPFSITQGERDEIAERILAFTADRDSDAETIFDRLSETPEDKKKVAFVLDSLTREQKLVEKDKSYSHPAKPRPVPPSPPEATDEERLDSHVLGLCANGSGRTEKQLRAGCRDYTPEQITASIARLAGAGRLVKPDQHYITTRAAPARA